MRCAPAVRRVIVSRMNRPLVRVLATVLWLLAGWDLGSFVANVVGLNWALGPLLGLALADFVGGDPFHVIWSRRVVREPPSGALARQADALR